MLDIGNLLDEETLQYALESGIINLSYVKDKIEMNKKEKILANHQYKIWKGNDNKWRTYLPNGEGRKLVKRSTENSIKDAIIQYYESKEKEEKNTAQYEFKYRFEVWVERQKMCERSDNTIYKYQTDYKRFFSGKDIERMDVRKINETDIIATFKDVLTNKEISYKALKSAFGYVNGVFKKSIIDRVVEKNPCDYVDLQLLKKYCREKTHNVSERTISTSDKKNLENKMEKSDRVIKYAIQLAFCTGMRVGELAALKWSDIDYRHNILVIQSSEKYNRLTKEYFIANTKNEKIRKIPLTQEMKDIFEKTRKHEIRNNCLGEFVFSDENGRVHCRILSGWMRTNTMTSEFEHTKSIHAIRRTLNSNMRCAGVPAPVAAAILGHTEKVNNENYTYDITTMKEKEEVLKAASV